MECKDEGGDQFCKEIDPADCSSLRVYNVSIETLCQKTCNACDSNTSVKIPFNATSSGGRRRDTSSSCADEGHLIRQEARREILHVTGIADYSLEVICDGTLMDLVISGRASNLNAIVRAMGVQSNRCAAKEESCLIFTTLGIDDADAAPKLSLRYVPVGKAVIQSGGSAPLSITRHLDILSATTVLSALDARADCSDSPECSGIHNAMDHVCGVSYLAMRCPRLCSLPALCLPTPASERDFKATATTSKSSEERGGDGWPTQIVVAAVLTSTTIIIVIVWVAHRARRRSEGKGTFYLVSDVSQTQEPLPGGGAKSEEQELDFAFTTVFQTPQADFDGPSGLPQDYKDHMEDGFVVGVESV